MPSSNVTPDRRRRRPADEDSDSDSQPGLGHASSANGKRLKLEPRENDDVDDIDGVERQPKEEDEDDVEEENEGNMNGRGQRGSTESGRDSSGPADDEFQPGAIVRIKLKDFVTYTSAEFFPGPKLNMVIGPNGTGKSTLVCAICLGLGWGPQHLGRAKEASEFVKHGCREATIEIELAKGPGFQTNPVITRTIKREGNKSTFTINGKEVSRKQVLKLAESFSIQIDNLCQFLPQDKVAEFAALSPVELLRSTQRAAAGAEMTEWHDSLIRLRAEQKKLLLETKNDRELLKNLENRQEMQRADVERVRERALIKRRIEMLELLRPVMQLRHHMNISREVRQQKEELQRELNDLEASVEPVTRSIDAKQQYCRAMERASKRKRNAVSNADAAASAVARRLEKLEDKMKDLGGQLETEKKAAAGYRQDGARLRQKINSIRHEMQHEPPQFDIESYNERIREIKKEIRALGSQAMEVKNARTPLFTKLEENKKKIDEVTRQLANLESRSGQQEKKLENISSDSLRLYRWLVKNGHKFEKPVFGPPVITCSVKDPKYADVIESMLNRNEMITFTTQTLTDFKTMQKEYRGQGLHDISLRMSTVPLEELKAPISDFQMRQLGFDGWLKDYLAGPEPVVSMLCGENNLHRTAVRQQDISDEEYRRLESGPLSSWVAGRQIYQVIRRREYGPGATSTRVRQVRQAAVWTNQPIDVTAKRELERKILQLKDDAREIQEQISKDREKLKQLEQEKNALEDKRVALEQEKGAKQSDLVHFQALPERLRQQEAKLKDIEDQFAKARVRLAEIRSKQDQVAIDKAETALEYARAVEHLSVVYEDCMQVEIQWIEAMSDSENLEERHKQVKEMLTGKKRELEEVMRRVRELSEESHRLKREANKVLQASREQPDLKQLMEELQSNPPTPDQLEADIDSEKARLDMTHEVGENVVKEFEDRQRQIDSLKERLAEHDQKLAEFDDAISEIRGKWEPQLDALVQKISDAFSDSFARIGCAGQVTIDKPQDEPGPNGEPGGYNFDQWSIQILVKFREQENLSILDSHRQSGGERAVSTIFYLMALQSLSASPFRVVDEINQGMDPRNERMVHERMVDIACAPRVPPSNRDRNGVIGTGGSQYFLITPKLLNGLVYKPGMKVLCIVSGEHMPSDYNSIDFGRAVKTMRRIRKESGLPLRGVGVHA